MPGPVSCDPEVDVLVVDRAPIGWCRRSRCATPRSRRARASPGAAAARRRGRTRPRRRRAASRARRGRGPGQDAEGQLAQLDVAGDDEVRVVGAGEGEQVVDEAGHPVELVVGDGERRRARRRVVAHRLEVAPDDRDGGAQIVAGVVEELALVGEGALEPVEHRVKAGTAGHLVTAADLEAAAEVGPLDLLGGAADVADGARHPPGHDPRGDAGEEEPHGTRAREDEGDDVDLTALEVAEHPDDEGAALLASPRR